MDNLVLQTIGDYVVIGGIILTIVGVLYVFFTNIVLPALTGKDPSTILSHEPINVDRVSKQIEAAEKADKDEASLVTNQVKNKTRKAKQPPKGTKKPAVAKSQAKAAVKVVATKKQPTQKSSQSTTKQPKKKTTSK